MKHISLAVAVLAGAAGPAMAQQEPAGSWADETSSYYFSRGGHATDGTYLYLFGGYQYGVSQSYPSYYRRARRYDPASNAWVTLANLPIVFSDITYQFNAGACAGGQLYSFGTSAEGANGIVLSYSISNNAWSVLDGVTVPESRYAAAAAVLGGRIYLSGGYAGGASTRVDEFNPADNSFTRCADLPLGVYLHAMVAAPSRGSVYAVGGMSDGGYVNPCFEYRPSTDTWSERAPISIDGTSRARGYLAAFMLRNRIYATGGRSNAGASPDVFEYHPASDTWAQRASMASARYQHAAVAIAGRGYVYGGLPVYSEGEEFTPPDFGPAPELESEVTQSGSQPESSLQAKEDATQRDGWTDGQVTFSATLSDPDPYDQVKLRIRLRRPGEPLWMDVDGGFQPQGLVQFILRLPTSSSYDWEYRIEDLDGNSFPAGADEWLPAFGNDSTPDLRSDGVKPTAPTALYPGEIDVRVGDPDSGEVLFGWTDGTDNRPGLVHEIEITRDGESEPEFAGAVPSGLGRAGIRLPVSEALRHWRIRARDIAGIAGAWSETLSFRVLYDDGINHASGDAKGCGFSAAPGAPLPVALLGAITFIMGYRRARMQK